MTLAIIYGYYSDIVYYIGYSITYNIGYMPLNSGGGRHGDYFVRMGIILWDIEYILL